MFVFYEFFTVGGSIRSCPALIIFVPLTNEAANFLIYQREAILGIGLTSRDKGVYTLLDISDKLIPQRLSVYGS